jgi:hypothetical protein
MKMCGVKNQLEFKIFVVFQILASIPQSQKVGRSEIFSPE